MDGGVGEETYLAHDQGQVLEPIQQSSEELLFLLLRTSGGSSGLPTGGLARRSEPLCAGHLFFLLLLLLRLTQRSQRVLGKLELVQAEGRERGQRCGGQRHEDMRGRLCRGITMDG